IVPLFLFPKGVAIALNFLPFAGMVSVPVNLFLGKYELQTAVFYIGLQCFWAVAMSMLTHGLYHRVIKKVVVQGG
ncbi:MAG: ABC-2 family transporter protein, partial [Lachnospiraceae bacterium]